MHEETRKDLVVYRLLASSKPECPHANATVRMPLLTLSSAIRTRLVPRLFPQPHDGVSEAHGERTPQNAGCGYGRPRWGNPRCPMPSYNVPDFLYRQHIANFGNLISTGISTEARARSRVKARKLFRVQTSIIPALISAEWSVLELEGLCIYLIIPCKTYYFKNYTSCQIKQ